MLKIIKLFCIDCEKLWGYDIWLWIGGEEHTSFLRRNRKLLPGAFPEPDSSHYGRKGSRKKLIT